MFINNAYSRAVMTSTSYEREKSQEAPVDLASLREADAILIGEVHNTKAHQHEQARLIIELQSEYVLHEGWDDATPEETNKIVRWYATATLQELVERGFSLQQWGIASDVIQRIEKKKNEMYEQYRELYQKKGLTPAGARQEARELVERDGLYPSTFMELLETPFYEWGMPVYEAVQELLLREQETESDKLQRVRERVTKRIRKHKLHHEQLQGKDYLYRAIAKTDGKLAGCDIKKNPPRLEDVIERDHQRGGRESQDATIGEEEESGYTDTYDRYEEQLDAYIKKTMAWRERTMGARIVNYAQQRVTKKPIIAIVGSDHLRPDSGIYPILEIAGIRWKTIIQLKHHISPEENVRHILRIMER